MGGVTYNAKALDSVHILGAGSATCSALRLGFPDFEDGPIPEARPTSWATPANYMGICHTAGDHGFTFATGHVFYIPYPLHPRGLLIRKYENVSQQLFISFSPLPPHSFVWD